MSDPSTQPADPPVAYPTGASAACVSCGFDLRTLDATLPCPECGSSIIYAARQNMLESSPVAFLERVALGARLITVGVVSNVLVSIASGVITMSLQLPPVTAATQKRLAMIENAQALIEAGLLLLVGAGVYLFTTPEPGGPKIPDGTMPRMVTRWCGLAYAGSIAISNVLSLWMDPDGITPPPLFGAIMLFSIIGLSMFSATFFAQMLYVRRLAARVSNVKLYRDAGRRMWLIPLLSTFGILLLLLGPLLALLMYLSTLEVLRKDLKALSGYASPGRAPAN